MPKTIVATSLNATRLGNSDKHTLTTLFNVFVDDIEKLRAANAALCAKLDSNHGAATDHVATIAIAAGGLSVSK